jgi:flagellar FliL protein
MASQIDVKSGPAPAPKKGGLVPMIAVAGVALAIGAGGMWFLKPKGDVEPNDAAAAEEAGHENVSSQEGGGEPGAGTEGGAHAPLSERLITLEPFVVNLDENGAKRFLRTRIELETGSPARQAELLTRSAQMRDAIIVLLTSKRLEDLGGLEGKVMLKNEIQRRLDDLLGADAIRSVLITEFVIQ